MHSICCRWDHKFSFIRLAAFKDDEFESVDCICKVLFLCAGVLACEHELGIFVNMVGVIGEEVLLDTFINPICCWHMETDLGFGVGFIDMLASGI